MVDVEFIEFIPLWTLAQGQGDPHALSRILFMMLMFGIIFYFLFWLPEKRKRDETKQQLERLKENDRVVTVGGIHGTITNIRRDQDIVTVRIDESTGTKIRIGLAAVARVVTDNKGDEAENTSKK